MENLNNISPEEFERICDEAALLTLENQSTQSAVDEPNHDEVTENNNASEGEVSYNTNFSLDSNARFSGAEWFDTIKKQLVLVGGCGGIGSWLTFLLSKLNLQQIDIFDYDNIDETNIGGQLYQINSIGNPKVYVMRDLVSEFSNYYRLNAYDRAYDRNCMRRPIMMSAFDNMDARKVFYRNWEESFVGQRDALFIDGRLSSECMQVFCVPGDDLVAQNIYKTKYLFDSSEADETVCSYKQTAFMANMIASMMVNIFVNWCVRFADGFRPLPFFVEYDAVTMQYKFQMESK